MPETSDSLRAAYEAWTPRSRELIEQARKVFPGGDTRATAHYGPYPVFIESGSGCRVVDADGHEYVDFMNNFTSLIHAHPGVVAAVAEQIRRGSAYAAPTRSQIELGRAICERVPSVDSLRFTSSGSEGTLMALRASRAVTGKPKIMKMEGGYHGSYDLAEVSLVPLPDLAGPLEAPVSVAPDRSIAPSALGDAVIAPFNEPELAADLIARHAEELACVIVEPIQGSMGMNPATPEFLRALREATSEHDVILVFDEVISLRTEYGGAQQHYGVTPDMTAMGKFIGGGLPVGAVGGRRDLLDVFNPERRDSIMHASTFSGNATTMAAGVAAMADLTPEVHRELNRLGQRLRDGCGRAVEAAGVPGRALGLGSLSNLVLSGREIRGPRDVLAAGVDAGPMSRLLHLGLLRRGVFTARIGMLCISTPMGEAEVDAAVAALRDALDELRPVIERERPRLLG